MKPVVKGSIAVAVLVFAAAVALVPRWQDDSDGQQQPSTESSALAQARQKAQLPSCPSSPKRQERKEPRSGVSALQGVKATCAADGSTVELGSALAGQVTVVNVWATWCAPCRDELPVLDTYAETPDAANVLTVQVNSGMADGLRMLAELDVHLPGVHDGTGKRGPVRAGLDVPNTLPASYVISADGTVHFVKQPRVFHTPGQVRAAVAEYGGDR